MRDTKHEIVQFWFEETQPELWFRQDGIVNQHITERFLVSYDMARDGLCNGWSSDAVGCLALCLLLGHFPRRLFVGEARAYETDERTLLFAKQAVREGFDQIVPAEQRVFLYLPFMRYESVDAQERGLRLFEALKEEEPEACQAAQRLYDVCERFGRFPERNAALGRESTPDELQYLDQMNEKERSSHDEI